MKKEIQPNEVIRNLRTWHFVGEIRWFIQLILTLFLLMSLITYDRNDVCWTVVADIETIHNWGGRFGALISDFLYFFWGWSALWILVAISYWTTSDFLRFIYQGSDAFLPKEALPAEFENAYRFSLFRAFKSIWNLFFCGKFVAFCLLLFSSSSLESLRFWSKFKGLYDVPGGIFGDLIGQSLVNFLGFTGSTLLLIALVLISLSIWWQFSWLGLTEWLGKSFIQTVLIVKNQFLSLKNSKIDAEQIEDRILDSNVSVCSDFQLDTICPSTDDPLGNLEKQSDNEPINDINLDVASVGSSHLKLGDLSYDEKRNFSKPGEKSEKSGVDIKKNSEIIKSPVLVKHNNFLPSLDLLDAPPVMQERVSDETLTFTKKLIEKKLKDFGVSVRVHEALPGPIVTRYEIEPDVGIKGSQIVNLAKDLARSFSLVSIRVVETIPGKNLMALELPNSRRQIVKLVEILTADTYQRALSPLTICLGKDIAGVPVCADLAKMPHLLVAGTTGSGKSVGINAMILSLLYKASPDQVRMILIDPKMLELSVYEGIPHLLCPVVIDMSQALYALNWAIGEMDRRYKLMSKLGVRNLQGYNSKITTAYEKGEPIEDPFALGEESVVLLETLPAIVIVIDELADLVMVIGKKIEELIARIAQKARAAGIHLILATQRPSVDVITGLIKANVPTRIAFQVSSKIDSRTILDQQGADTLLGMGDMLYLPPGSGVPIRVHGAFVSDEEVARIVDGLRATGEPNYIDGILDGAAIVRNVEVSQAAGQEDFDPLYDQAVEIVLKHRRASISLVQRHLRIGYNRAARLLEQMENAQLVSSMGANGNREILVPNSENI